MATTAPHLSPRLLPAVGLMVLTLVTFAGLRSHDFVSYDDQIYVFENPNLQLGLSRAGLWRACLPYEHNWIPLTFLSLLLDHAVHGLHAPGYLATNALLHTASSVLLFASLRRMTGAAGASWFVAAVFAVHPLHVESVAWVSERKDCLAGVFWMLGMYAHACLAEAPSRSRQAWVALWLLLGLLAKPLLVSLPFALLLLDFWPLRRLGDAAGGVRAPKLAQALGEKLPLLALVGLFSWITVEVQRLTGALNSFSALPLPVRVSNALVSYVAYLSDALWPRGLAVFYPHPFGSLPPSRVMASGLLLAVLTAAALALRRRAPALIMGWLWFLGTLVPMIGLVQVGMHARADRYMYIPLIGLAIALAFGLEPLTHRSRGTRRVLAAAGGVSVLALSLACAHQLFFWRDSASLYRRALAVTRGNFLAHYGLAGAIAGGAPLEVVEKHLERALLYSPGWAPAQEKLLALRDAQASLARGQRALEAGALEPARKWFGQVASSGFSPPELSLGLAQLSLSRGDERSAIAHLEQALRGQPHSVETANHLAWLLATSRDPALRSGEAALAALAGVPEARRRGDPILLDTWAAALAAQGQMREAEAKAQQALQLALERHDAELAAGIRRRAQAYAEGHLDPGPARPPQRDGP